MKPAKKRQYTVFLSHSSRDSWLAAIIAQKFRTVGAKVWIDEMSLVGGDELLSALAEGMRSVDEAVVVVSSESLKSQWVAAEIGMAVVLKKRITGLLNNVDYDAMAPLKGIKSYELNVIDKFVQQLKRRVAERKRKH